MNISDASLQNLSSIRQAIGMVTLRNTLHQDKSSLQNLMKSMEENTEAIKRMMEPHKGSNINIKV